MHKARKYFVCSVITVLFIAFVLKNRTALSDMTSVFLFTVILSFGLSPICSAAERRGISSSASAAIALSALILFILISVSALVPYLIAQSIDLIQRSVPLLSTLLDRLLLLHGRPGIALLEKTGLSELLLSYAKELAYNLAGWSASVVSKMGLFFFAVVLVYYVLKERRILCSHLLLFIPSAWRGSALYAMQSCKNAMLSYFSAVVKTSVLVACLTYLMLIMLGIPNSFLLALFMGLFEILPYIGPVIASVPILLSCLSIGGNTVLSALILLILIQQIEGNLITPYLTASSTSVHPLAALIGVFVFGKLFGIGGIFFAVPIIMIARNIFWSLIQFINLMKDQEMIET